MTALSNCNIVLLSLLVREWPRPYSSNPLDGTYTINLGSGNDKVVAAGGNTINLGSGQDVVDMSTASAATGNTISGFGGQDQIDLDYIGFGPNTTVAYTPKNSNTGGTLTVNDDNGNIANIALLGQYVAGSFALSSDGHGGTLVADPAVVAQSQVASPHA